MSFLLYVYSEKGEMHLAKPDSKAFVPVSRFTVPEETKEHWAHPTIGGDRLYIRHGDAMIAYDIKAGS